jgi:hypothetical protein
MDMPRNGEPSLRKWTRFGGLIATALLVVGCAVDSLSTDIPIEFHDILKEKYEGRNAWTRLTLEDEKKNIKIEQDQEVQVVTLGLQRSGSVVIQTLNGRKRVVYPFRIERPLTLEHFERALLDALWFEDPDSRYASHKEQYGTRIADAIRDHNIFNDMSMYVAYLAWGAPSKIIPIKRGSDERWEYATPNLKNASIDFRGGKVEHFSGENVADTEAATKRKRVRRGP